MPAHVSILPTTPRRLSRHSAHRTPLVLAILAGIAPIVALAHPLDARDSAVDLPKISVTATLSEHDTRLAPASITVIDRTELDKLNPQNLLQAVRAVPGVTLSPRQVGGRKTLSLRGMEGRHVLTMVAGRRIIATDDVVGHSDYQYGWLPMAAVERIEVIRGPMSTLYGSEALGGVINLITRKPGDNWSGDINLRGATTQGNEGHRQGSGALYVAGPVGERVDLRISAFSGYTPAVADPDDRRYSEIEGSRAHAGTLGASIQLNSTQRLELNHLQNYEQRFYDDVSRAGTAYVNTYDIRRRQSDLAWHGDFDHWQGQLGAYSSDTSIINHRNNGVSPTRPQALSDRIVDGHFIRDIANQTLTFGGELRREGLTNAGLVDGHDEALHKALFVQDEASLGHGVALTAGVRLDHHELFGHEWSPRLYLVWEARPDLVIKGGYGHAFKAPTLKQISPNYVGAEGPHTFRGNAAIRPESLDSVELAVNWQLGALNLQATVFRSRVEDLITYKLLKVEGPRRFYQYDNVDSARIDGIETGLIWDISNAWSWQANYNVLDARDGNTGKRLEYRPRTSANSHLEWSGAAGWSARLGLQRYGSQASSEGTLPAYNVWNLRASKHLGAHVDLSVAVENLTNLRLADESPLFGYAERGRTISTNLRYRF